MGIVIIREVSCRYCGRKFKERGIRSHEVQCKKNPNVVLSAWCIICHREINIRQIDTHIKSCLSKLDICPECGNEFLRKGKTKTCSCSCANRYFKKGNFRENISDDELIEKGRYTTLCFRYHEKKCIVCGEINIVSVHHYNGIHSDHRPDHRPDNLVPLCPTHHKYMHSRFHKKIEGMVDLYIRKFKSTRSDLL